MANAEAIGQESPAAGGEQTEFQPGLGVYTYSVKWGLGETQEFDVFTGKKRHIIKLICTD